MVHRVRRERRATLRKRVWQEIDSGRRRIILGGYETATPPLDTFEWNERGMPRSYGTYKGTTLGLTLEVTSPPTPFRAKIPDNITSIIYAALPNISTSLPKR